MSAAGDYLSLPLARFLGDLAARTPSPGGGSAAAVAGALSVALARMVAAFAAGNKKNAAHATRLRALGEELHRASGLFAELMGEDIAAYERYAAARTGPDAAEKGRALATAIAVPMEIAAVAEAVSERLHELKPFVGPGLYSDLQAAAILAFATAEAAAWTVTGNLAHLSDKDEALRLGMKLDEMLERARRWRDAVVDGGRP